jgi:hypothetical protein
MIDFQPGGMLSSLSSSCSNSYDGYSNKCAINYHRDDYESFRDEASAVIGWHRRQEGACPNELKADAEVYCLRGLEGRTLEGAKKKNAVRQRARNAVMEEQYRQKRENKGEPLDFDLIAEIYKGFSLTSVSLALRIAKTDAAYSRNLLREIIAVDFVPIFCKKKIDDDAETASTVSTSLDSF